MQSLSQTYSPQTNPKPQLFPFRSRSAEADEESKKRLKERTENLLPIPVHINLFYSISYIILIIKVLWAGHDPPNLKKSPQGVAKWLLTLLEQG